MVATGVPLAAGCLGGGDGTETPDSSGGGSNSDGNGESDSNDNQGGNSNTEINFWAKEPSLEEFIRELANDYDGAQVDTSIVPEADLATELNSARAANTLPNVVQSAMVTGQLMVENDITANEQATQIIEDLGEDDFYDQALALVSAPDGGYFSVPHSIDIQTLGWRTSKFEEVGLSEPPTSWEGIEAAAEAFHDPDNDEYGIGIGSAHHRFTRQCFQPIALSNGARVFNEDGEIIFDNPEMVEAIEFYAMLQSEYGIPGDHDHVPVFNAYVDETIHFLSFSSYILGLITDNGGEEMARDTNAAFTHSSSNGEAAAGNATLFTVLDSNAQSQLTASEGFVEYMYTGDAYVEWLHDNLGAFGPTRKSVFESDAYQDHDNWDIWEEDLQERQEVMDSTLQRFGIVNGTPQTGIGAITSQLLIAEAVSRAIDGENASDVASEVADKMRNAIE